MIDSLALDPSAFARGDKRIKHTYAGAYKKFFVKMLDKCADKLYTINSNDNHY